MTNLMLNGKYAIISFRTIDKPVYENGGTMVEEIPTYNPDGKPSLRAKIFRRLNMMIRKELEESDLYLQASYEERRIARYDANETVDGITEYAFGMATLLISFLILEFIMLPITLLTDAHFYMLAFMFALTP